VGVFFVVCVGLCEKLGEMMADYVKNRAKIGLIV
jgi:hypothetical protein